MARLTEIEKQQLRARPLVTGRSQRVSAAREPVSMGDYLDFLEFSIRFNRTPKPVRFIGNQWKL